MGDKRKTVFITGCSSGIGSSLARTFNSAGLEVIATARSASSLESLSTTGIHTLSLEVTSEASIQACYASVEQLLGPDRGLDYLVQNAGRNYVTAALDVDMDEVRGCFETNVFAVMRLTQRFAPLVIKAKGTILMIGSVSAVVPMVFGSVYNATKAALKLYSDTLRVELEPFGVSVVQIITGGVKSQIGRTVKELPEDSLYHPVATEFKRRQGFSQEGAMESDDYAKSVVAQVMGSEPWPWRWFMKDARKPWIWNGANIAMIYLFGGGWMWHRMFDMFFKGQFGLSKLEKVKTQ